MDRRREFGPEGECWRRCIDPRGWYVLKAPYLRAPEGIVTLDSIEDLIAKKGCRRETPWGASWQPCSFSAPRGHSQSLPAMNSMRPRGKDRPRVQSGIRTGGARLPSPCSNGAGSSRDIFLRWLIGCGSRSDLENEQYDRRFFDSLDHVIACAMPCWTESGRRTAIFSRGERSV